MQDTVQNLVLDYDGVIKYKDKILSEKAKNILFSYIEQKIKAKGRFVLHVNSFRGRTFFSEDIPFEIRCEFRGKIDFFFSGCGGAFIFDFMKQRVVTSSKGLSEKVLEFIAKSSVVKNVLEASKQDDRVLWGNFKDEILPKWKSIIDNEPRLYWDIGFPGSEYIHKCTIDFPPARNFEKKLTKEILGNLFGIKVNINEGKYFDVTVDKGDKGSIMREAMERRIYAEGSLLAIGDTPRDGDKPMLTAFKKDLGKKRKFLGRSNRVGSMSSLGEELLLEGFKEIIYNFG